MKNKDQIIKLVLIIATVVLGGVAVFIAFRLYTSRQTSIAPNAPESNPGATSDACQVTFSLSSATSSATPTGTATATATATATSTATSTATATATATSTATSTASATPTATATSTPNMTPEYPCNSTCTSDSQCQKTDSKYICYSQTKTCRHQDYPTQSNCYAPGTTGTPNPTLPPVPVSGVNLPTVLGIGMGALLILGALGLLL